MVIKRPQFVNDEIYHVVLRAIDENLIFKDTDDYYRGIFSIYEFNTTKPVSIKEQRKIRTRIKKAARGLTSGNSVVFEKDEREKMVEILSFCFMPNHIHLLLKQLKNNGVTDFMRKVGTGYAGYFNRKYNRKGHVFQNRFLAVLIKDDNQLKIVFTYVHANPISLIEPNWKEVGIKESEKTIGFLENYKWSSYQDYIGKKNFPSVTERKFLSEIMDKEQGCKNFIENWIEYKKEIKDFGDAQLE